MRHNIFDSIPSDIVSSKDNVFANFLQTAGLYDSMKINEDNIADLIELLKGNVKISAYCKECKQERVFYMKPIEYYFETGPDGNEEIRCASLGEKIESLQNMIFSTKSRQEKSPAEEWKWINWQIADITRLMKSHVMRHTGCTNMASSGVNIKAAQYIMGHAKSDITLDVYNHLNNRYDAKAEIEKLEKNGTVMVQ